MTARNLSPVLRRELANLDKDADSRKSAMKALRSYVKDLDSKAIPLFLAQVSETKEIGSLSGEYTISLYEVLARTHGPKIVPQIDSIMETIIKTLASSAGSFPLQQACSKVVPAIARYGIDPTMPEGKKRHIIQSLCKPLSDSLMGSQECLTSGAALCLKALVDSDNWRFASDDVVNNVCQNVAGALAEKCTQTNSHIGLVMALAKRNALIVEAYARLLIQSGLQILEAGVFEGNSQKRLSAIQMLNFLMKCLDPRSIFSELDSVINEMEKCQTDQMAYVKGAAFEALQTAKTIAVEKLSKFEKSSSSFASSNSYKKDSSRRNAWGSSRTSGTASPESQTLDSFAEYDFSEESPISMPQFSENMGYEQRGVSRKLWSYENGGVDVSLKDGLFSEVAYGNASCNTYPENFNHRELNGNGIDHTETFAGFLQTVNGNGLSRSASPSPQRSRSNINIDRIDLFTTPRRLIHSLQDPNDVNLDFSRNGNIRFRSPSSRKTQHGPTVEYNQNGFSHDVKYEDNETGELSAGDEQVQGGSESVSSTDDVVAHASTQVTHEVTPKNKITSQELATRRIHRKNTFNMAFGIFFVILVVFISLLFTGAPDEGYHLVPT